VNAHHDAWYEPDPAHIDQAEAALRNVWGQIARRFADYGERLLFEGMNEPRLIGDPEEWTAGTPAARDCVNRLNAAFVETVRASEIVEKKGIKQISDKGEL
ncbi:MAG TPA: cellulase family glycosylhydrolase, partial [Clostridia bacterium]|nr:cellulase family glycosylhydrolase [Clostridia bacterium]